MHRLTCIVGLVGLASCAQVLGGLDEGVGAPPAADAGSADVAPRSDAARCEPWLDGFGRRVAVAVAVSSTTKLTAYSFPLALDTEALIARHVLRSDGADLRVTSADGTTELPFWLATGLGTHETLLWTKTDLAPGSNLVRVYYDAPDAAARSDEHATFLDGVIDNADFAAGTRGWFSRGPTGLGHATFDIDKGAARIRLERDTDAGSVGSTSAAWCQLVRFPLPLQDLIVELEQGPIEESDVWIGGLATSPVARFGTLTARRDVVVTGIPGGASSLCLGLSWVNAGGYVGDGEDRGNELDVAFRNLRLRPHVDAEPVAGFAGAEERACGR
jgi:hypothetical protein